MRIPTTPPHTPPPHDYPFYRFILDHKSKQDKVKVTHLKDLPKIKIVAFWKTQIHVTHQKLLGSGEYCWRWGADTILSTDGLTDRWTDGRKNGPGGTSIPPSSTSLKRRVWWYSNCFAINIRPNINGKEWCLYIYIYIYIYIYVYIPRASDKYFEAYISGLSRRYNCIATVYSWQTETGTPYCNIGFLSSMVSIFKTILDGYNIIHSLECKVCDRCSLYVFSRGSLCSVVL